MSLRFIDTGLDGPDECLEQWLLPRLEDAQLVAAQSGFFSMPGWQLVARPFREVLQRGGNLHLVVGGRPEQASPEALREALHLSRQFPDQFSLLAVIDGAAIHTAKAYYIRTVTGDCHGWVGSANLTGRGMQINYQAGIQLDSHNDDPAQLQRILESVKAWEDHQRPALRVDDRYIRELWPATCGGIFSGQPNRLISLRDSLEATLDTIEAIDSQTGPATDDAAVAAAAEAQRLAPKLPDGISTGLVDLDELLSGLRTGTFTVLGGLEAMGKTALLLHIIRATCRLGTLAGYLTLQTGVDEITHRLLAAEAGIPLYHLRSGLMSDADWSALAKTMQVVSDWPLQLAAHATLTLDQLLLQLDQLADRGARLVAIDMPTQISVPQAESREQELSQVSAGLKAAAMHLDIAIVGALPLGRGPHQRTDKRPEIQDLRGTGQASNDADIALLLHRDDAFWRGPDVMRPNEADIIVAKNRLGPSGNVIARFDAHTGRFGYKRL